MRNRKTIGLIWVLPLAVLSVVGLQALGINRVIELRGQIFDKEVARSLTELSEGILVTANIPFEEAPTQAFKKNNIKIILIYLFFIF